MWLQKLLFAIRKTKSNEEMRVKNNKVVEEPKIAEFGGVSEKLSKLKAHLTTNRPKMEIIWHDNDDERINSWK